MDGLAIPIADDALKWGVRQAPRRLGASIEGDNALFLEALWNGDHAPPDAWVHLFYAGVFPRTTR